MTGQKTAQGNSFELSRKVAAVCCAAVLGASLYAAPAFADEGVHQTFPDTASASQGAPAETVNGPSTPTAADSLGNSDAPEQGAASEAVPEAPVPESLAPAVPPAGALTLSESSLMFEDAQDSATLAAAGAQGAVSWKSTDPRVATVSDGGVVTAVGAGTCRIIARDDAGVEASCEVKASAFDRSDASGRLAYLRPDGSRAQGMVSVHGSRYLFDANGWARSGWQKNDGVWMHFDPKTFAAVTGWNRLTWNDRASWYLFDAEGRMLTGWQKNDRKWYLLSDSGRMLKGWQKDEGSWYHMAFDGGAMETGWIKSGGSWYLLGESGRMRTGWQKVDGSWYHLDDYGRMDTGWLKLHGTWYLLSSGGRMLTGWQKVGGEWYYLYEQGDMASDEWVGDYYVRPNGEWSDYAASYKTGYQNPSGYYQLSSKNVYFNGYGSSFDYATPSRIAKSATRSEAIEAFIDRAYDYRGTDYVWNWSKRPGEGVDCIGLVFQCAYACGMDLDGGTKNFDDFNPYTHYMTGANGWHSHDADNMWNYGKVQHLSLSQRERGDVIYWPGHVAIYLGNDKIIEAFGDDVHITSLWSHRSSPTGVMRFFVK
ncbi:NlpC/P60 family protein [Slackia exigua]|uniref:NlpC/P60 family protein n=1 Tax=Slackia exigua TaxID=84109 RepID=UPI003B9F994B